MEADTRQSFPEQFVQRINQVLRSTALLRTYFALVNTHRTLPSSRCSNGVQETGYGYKTFGRTSIVHANPSSTSHVSPLSKLRPKMPSFRSLSKILALAALATSFTLTSAQAETYLVSGDRWRDTDGEFINAHAGELREQRLV